MFRCLLRQQLKCRLEFISPEDKILCVWFSGYLRAGFGRQSRRNSKWRISFVIVKPTEYQPAAILFDLIGLDYAWGDAIWSIVGVLMRQARTLRVVAPYGGGSSWPHVA